MFVCVYLCSIQVNISILILLPTKREYLSYFKGKTYQFIITECALFWDFHGAMLLYTRGQVKRTSSPSTVFDWSDFKSDFSLLCYINLFNVVRTGCANILYYSHF